jgi:hypothetical protein
MASYVVNAIGLAWEHEEIPNTDLLFMRIHRNLLYEDGTPMLGAFQDQGDSMSTD